MGTTQINIDDEALAEAMRLAGVRTKREMVNLALREYSERRKRSEALLRHFAQAQTWDDTQFWREHETDKQPR